MHTAADLFGQALKLHQGGSLADAEALYRQILAAEPAHADSLHLLGVVARQTGRPALAVDLITRALAITPQAATFRSNLGNALGDLGRREEAAVSYRAAISLQPDHADSHYNLGNTLRDQGEPEAAAASYRSAIAARPGHANAHLNLACVLRDLGRLAESAEACRQAILLGANSADAYNLLGVAYAEQGRAAQAIASYRQALALQPDHAEALGNLGTALREAGHSDEALGCLRRAVALTPDSPNAHSNLSVVLRDQGAWAEAEACCRTAIALRADLPEIHNNLANVLRDQGRLEEAIAWYRSALVLRPDFWEVRFHLAMALLARGDLEQGWQEYEYRWNTRQMAARRRAFTQPQWRGEAAAGQTLLIHAEQGFGDTLQFCRYATLAAGRGMRVVLEVQAPLERLLRGLTGVARVIAHGDKLPAFDLHCPMLSLPLAFATTLENIPGASPYLYADPAQVARWTPGGAASGPRVGLVWAGNAHRDLPVLRAVGRRRSFPPERLAPLIGIAGVHFFTLQKDGPAASAAFGLTDHMAEMEDFADTAALIATLDLVITVDTAVAHLAAALGRPVWMMDRFDPCWRLPLGRSDSPWYPTLRIYRQAAPGAWDPVIADIARDLRRLAG